MSTFMSYPSVLFRSSLATGVYNLDSSRFRKASLDTRSEGWTETWGGKELQAQQEQQLQDTNVKQPPNSNHRHHEGNVLVFEDTTSSMWAEIDDQDITILLTQFRPAWFEQMVLRVAKIPYIVVNSTYNCNEATGQLPYLRDCQESKPPILVGRHHPTNLVEFDNTNDASPKAISGGGGGMTGAVCGNSILAYLKEFRHVDLDGEALTSDQQRGLSRCFLHLVQSELGTILLFLRFQDQDAWEQIYRRQYIQASCPKRRQETEGGDPSHINWFLQLRGRFQAMMERAVEQRRLLEYSRNKSVPEVVEIAKEIYLALERQLLSVNEEGNGKKRYLLGTDRPALVDAALFAHLANALCDVHLVVELASFPALVQYFQDMYQSHFSPNLGRSSPVDSCWEEWNERQNLENAFQQIPILANNQSAKSGAFKDAIDLMQKLSLQKQDLKEVLGAVKAKRDDEPWPLRPKPSNSLFYRWSMGEDLEKKTYKPEKEENPMRKKMQRDQIRNDQRWISGVGIASAISILLLQAGVSSE